MDYVNKIICGDCIDVMAEMPDESVDLVFADPPFNVGKQYPNGDKISDYRKWCKQWIDQCFRVLKPTGSFYLMTLSRHLEWKMPIMARHGMFINLITWRNVSASHSKRKFWGEYQPIMLYGKTDKYTFNTYAQTIKDGERRWGGNSTEYKGQYKDRWDDIPFVYAGSIKHKEAVILEGTNRKAHPCQMPIALAERAILFSSNEDDIVLDPFLGSGTTVVACKRTRRKYIGIELSSEYCKLAENRLTIEDEHFFARNNIPKSQQALF